jgi:hypothetical protein
MVKGYYRRQPLREQWLEDRIFIWLGYLSGSLSYLGIHSLPRSLLRGAGATLIQLHKNLTDFKRLVSTVHYF